MDNGSLNVENTLGCFFLTGILSIALWAISAIQLYNYFYYGCSRKDSLQERIYILLVYLLETVYQVVLFHSVYVVFIKNFSNLSNALRLNRSDIPLLTLLAAVIAFLVQGFYLKRIWKLSNRNKLLAGGIAILILGQFSIIITFFAITYPLKELHQFLSIVGFAQAMNMTVGCVEIIIGGVMIYLMHMYRSRLGSVFEHTNAEINAIIFYTAASGLLTGLDAIIAAILSFVLPHTLYYLLFCGIGSTLYVNSMLLLLNSRHRNHRTLNSGLGGIVVQVQPQMNLTSLRGRSGRGRSDPEDS